MTAPSTASDLSEIVDHVQRQLEEKGSLIVALEGKGCSGKTMVSRLLADALKDLGHNTSIMPIDNFCRPKIERYRADCPEGEQVYRQNFDYDLFDTLVAQAATSRSLYFEHAHLVAMTDRYEGQATYSLSPGGVLIVEGLFVLRRKLTNFYDLALFIELSDHEQLQRARHRDLSRGNTPEDIEFKYKHRYQPSYNLFMAEHLPEKACDILVGQDFVRQLMQRQ